MAAVMSRMDKLTIFVVVVTFVVMIICACAGHNIDDANLALITAVAVMQ